LLAPCLVLLDCCLLGCCTSPPLAICKLELEVQG
jgi:hypothetical protein